MACCEIYSDRSVFITIIEDKALGQAYEMRNEGKQDSPPKQDHVQLKHKQWIELNSNNSCTQTVYEGRITNRAW